MKHAPNTEVGRLKINAYVWIVNYRMFHRTQYLNAAIHCTKQALQIHQQEAKA